MLSRNMGLSLMSAVCEAVQEDAAAGEAPAATPATPKKKTEVETVKLSDGREVDFPGKRKLLKESLFPEGGLPQVRLDFRNGDTRTYQITADFLNRFAAHGAEQKLGDTTAGVDDVDDMVLEVDDLIERLGKGEWNIRREGDGMAGTSILLKALCEVSQKSPEKVREFLKGKSQVEKMALRTSAQLKPVVDRLEAEKINKGAKVDTDALLGALEAA